MRSAFQVGGGGVAAGLARSAQAGGAQFATHLQARREEIPCQHEGEHGVGADDVFQVTHGAAPLVAASLATQSLPASRRRLSARARASSEPANQNLVATTI